MSREREGDPRAVSVADGESGGVGVGDSSEANETPAGGVPLAGGAVVEDVAAHVDAGVERILRAFEEKLRYDASKQQAVDRLYSELQEHRSDLVGQAVRPFVLSMIRQHAEIGKLSASVRKAPAGEMTVEKFCSWLNDLQEDLEETLAENGVPPYRAQVGDGFDPVRQTVVGAALETNDAALAGTVASCLSPGFERDGKLLVKARVSAYGRRAGDAVD